MGHSFQIKTQCCVPGCDVTHGDGDLPLLQFTVAPTLIVGASDPEFNTPGSDLAVQGRIWLHFQFSLGKADILIVA